MKSRKLMRPSEGLYEAAGMQLNKSIACMLSYWRRSFKDFAAIYIRNLSTLW
jgi:hypothetical protein